MKVILCDWLRGLESSLLGVRMRLGKCGQAQQPLEEVGQTPSSHRL